MIPHDLGVVPIELGSPVHFDSRTSRLVESLVQFRLLLLVHEDLAHLGPETTYRHAFFQERVERVIQAAEDQFW